MKNPFKKKKYEVKEIAKEEPTEVIETNIEQKEPEELKEEQISFGKEAAQQYNIQVQLLQVQIETLKVLKEMLEFIKK